jgi:tetratricopeptide (TPR) repeat protein
MRALVASILGVALAAWISASVDPLAYAGGRSRDEADRLRRNRSAVARMLGEFRTSMSDLMFLKTERYLHGGVGYVPHHDEEALSSAELADEVEEHQGELGIPDEREEEAHSGIQTLIPVEEADFRGFVGRLHRAVKPWRDPSKPHIHTDGRELLPWFRLMTTVDPQYVRGYVAGGFWLQLEDRDVAMGFIEEGIERNPGAFPLYVSRGILRLKLAREAGFGGGDVSPATRPGLESAREDFRAAAELAYAQRTEEGWERYVESDAATAFHLAAVLTGRLGDPDGARELARRYLEVIPDYAPLLDLLGVGAD